MKICFSRRRSAFAADGSCTRGVVPGKGWLCQVRRESRRSVYVILKVAEANAEPILQRLRAAAASVKILDRDTFMSRVQTDESLKRKREQQDEALRATDSSLVGRLLALRGDGGDSKSRRRDGSGACRVLVPSAHLLGFRGATSEFAGVA